MIHIQYPEGDDFVYQVHDDEGNYLDYVRATYGSPIRSCGEVYGRCVVCRKYSRYWISRRAGRLSYRVLDKISELDSFFYANVSLKRDPHRRMSL